MPVKIRLARHGRKRRPFYYIVAADSRAPRDGRYIERIGSYNPNTDPASIDLNFDKALNWLQNGAIPTDTCRVILSYKGVIYKNHLLKGVTKGALTEEEAETKFNAWMKDKEQKIQAKADKIKAGEKAEKDKRFKIEEEVNKARAEELSAKKAKAVEDTKKDEAQDADTVTDSTEEVKSEEPKVEEKKAEVKEEPKAEVKEEKKVEEKKEEPKAEVKEEKKVEEKKEEPKAEVKEEKKEEEKKED